MNKGLIHIYTGDGKGKTTAALGLMMRAAGYNKRILFMQFLKSADSGEIDFIKNLTNNNIHHFSSGVTKKFVKNMTDPEKFHTILDIESGLKYIEEMYKKSGIKSSHAYDMVVLDEIMATIHAKFVNVERIAYLLINKPRYLEIVLTGRKAPEELVEIADYVSYVKAIKHPYTQGIKARKGIEY